MVRVRPMNTSEKERGCKSVLKVDKKSNQIEIFKEGSKDPGKQFAYDSVYGADSTQ